MVVRRPGEAHRALEQLEEYHASLVSYSSQELKHEIEKLINNFKSALFQSLIDIQDLYEETLLNDRKSLAQKAYETRKIAERWENNPPFGRPSNRDVTAPLASVDTGFHYLDQHSPYANGTDTVNTQSYQEQRRQYSSTDGWRSSQTTITQLGPGGQYSTTTANGYTDTDGVDYEVEEIVLEKGHTGLGFSIAGGVDQPYFDGDPHIYVTNIIPGGAASADQRMKPLDVILKVNSTDCSRVPHEVTVNALKNAGNVVRLTLRRRRTGGRQSAGLGDVLPHYNNGRITPVQQISPNATAYPPAPPPHHSSLTNIPIQRAAVREIERLERLPGAQKVVLYKGQGGLGFSIAGGVGNEHVQGDTGIYVTKVNAGSVVHHDGRINVGDKLLAVDDVPLENVTHEFAVGILKQVSNKVTILFQKNPHPELLPAPTMTADDSPNRSVVTLPAPLRSDSLSRDSFGSASQPVHAVTPQEIPLGPRNVPLNKGMQGLGFNIVGGEEGEPIYISYVLPGGVADLSGGVHKGDVLLMVNGIDLRNAVHAEAAKALKEATNPVSLTLQHRPKEYAEFEAKIDRLRREMMMSGADGSNFNISKRDVYVRALFDYDPSRDAGVPHRSLGFYYGDILHVVNTADDEWWTARLVDENGVEGVEGVIPSKKRVEKKERQRRKQVNFNAGSQSLPRQGMEGRRGSRSQLSFSRKFPFVKSTERLNEFSDNERCKSVTVPINFMPKYLLGDGTTCTSGTTDNECLGTSEEPIPSYVVVERQQVNYPRPVIILGAMKDRINDELVQRDRNRFTSCVPHTSRPPKPNEVDGRDYHFVSKEQMQEDVRNNQFIEAGQFQDNLYGTSINSVREVAQMGRHCILDVSGNAIRRLQTSANIYPIAIFIKPQSHHQIMDWDHTITEEEAINQFQRCQRIEQNFGDLFTAVVNGQTAEDLVRRVLMIISEQSRPQVWIPSRNQIF
ncbi:hypothetical protein AB6A40_000516 [Gnathostoma spinigerum]|uniref:Uncharacterized protein n=1 Tax=Gnathostoma spinigerum TaxID=75299 RepID=A0ABD6EBE7_9BILA